MTRLDVVQMIGDIITEIDVARGSLLPDDPDRLKLDDLRVLLDDRQRKLSQAVFDENTPGFQSAGQALKSVNDQIQGTIQDVTNIVNVFDNINRFLGAVNSLISTVAPFL